MLSILAQPIKKKNLIYCTIKSIKSNATFGILLTHLYQEFDTNECSIKLKIQN
jgi:hypothetical protein